MSILLILGLDCWAQGKVRGKILEDNGQPSIGATIQRVDDLSIGTLTDFDGNFSLEVPGSVKTELVIKFLGFNDLNVIVDPDEGEVQVVQLTMVTNSVIIGEGVVITARANKATDGYMARIKQKSATSIDYISNATLKKTGDGDMGSAVKRISGVSTVGNFVSVRGLADRYIATSVNGSRIPTLDPFTNNIRLDLFPAGLIDNLVITKTGSPEISADWSGAYISVETKDYPDELDIRVNTTFGYNTQSTFKEVRSAQSDKHDWLGYDNGFRDIPSIVNSYGDFPPRTYTLQDNTSQLLYPVFQNLGLQSYLNQFGITENSYSLGPQQELFNLMMVELGLLAPGQIYSPSAISEALQEFNAPGGLREGAINSLNSRVGEVGKSFNNAALYPTSRQVPLDFSQSFSIGNQIILFGRPLGFTAGFKLTKTSRNDPSSIRADSNANLPSNFQTQGNIPFIKEFYNIYTIRDASRFNDGWSALGKLSYKLNRNNSVSVLFMPNMYGVSESRLGALLDINDTGLPRLRYEQYYEERKQLVYQARTEHFVKGPDIRVQLDASFTDGQSNTLDFMDWQAEYVTATIADLDLNADILPQLASDSLNFTLGVPRANRSYRYLNENLLDLRGAVEVPILRSLKRNSFIKCGGSYRKQTRRYAQKFYDIAGLNNNQSFFFDEIDSFFADERFDVVNGVVDLRYSGNDNSTSNSIGLSKIWAAYIGLDHKLTEKLRTSLGVRIEGTDMLYDLQKYYDLHLANDSPERGILVPSIISQINLLPSLNLIYTLVDDDEQLVNIRGSYFRSLARPGLREISVITLYEFTLQTAVAGNPDLKITDVDNCDLRLEKYIHDKGNISASVFYKSFKNHIEMISDVGNIISWTNADRSITYGAELEGSYKLPLNLEVIGNLTLIKSETSFFNASGEKFTRTMFGQAPYILNGTLSYEPDSLGLQIAFSYNRQGRKLALVNDTRSTSLAQPDVVELPMNLIDVTVSKSLGKHFGVNLSVNNLLNASRQRIYDYDNYNDVYFDRFTWGTNYKLGFSYKL